MSPIRNPKPSRSFDDIWGDILPVLDILFSDIQNVSASTIDNQTYMKAYTACVDLCAGNIHPSDKTLPALQNPGLASLFRPSDSRTHKSLLFYEKLDAYFAEIVRSLGSPQDTLLDPSRIITRFQAYATAVKKIDGNLNYFNRHLVQRWRDEGKGWIDKSGRPSKDQRALEDQLIKWGYRKGEGSIAEYEAYAEAGAPLTTVASIRATALRRFRTDFVERLDLGVAEVADSEKEAMEVMLKEIGFPPEHPWRNMLRGPEIQTDGDEDRIETAQS
uniref:Uncharacterized protein n=1 Tax=Moniliophthora roreri TaxID=221103 RepID=A0A0W0FF53_MONRR